MNSTPEVERKNQRFLELVSMYHVNIYNYKADS